MLVILTKWKRKGVATIIGENEQRIEERSNNSCKWTKDRKKEQHQLLLKMYKRQKKGIVIVATNEQMIEKRSFLFRKK
jgi:hypothetical protein